MTLACALASCSPPADGATKQPSAAGPQLIAASGAGEVAPVVAAALTRAKAQQTRLVVYVGAAWCEPCRYFHDAVAKGELESALPGTQFLEFDYDRSKDALVRAGYVSQLIPLFALPNADGTASARRIEGSIKGPTAVRENLLPRLSALLAGETTSL